MNIFRTETRQIRNVWWIAIFYLVLSVFTFPAIWISQYFQYELGVEIQALIVVVTSFICQHLMKLPFNKLTGTLDSVWVMQLLKGLGAGALLMLLPALFLFAGGWVTWEVQQVDFYSLVSSTVLFVAVAVAEEFLFRGFIFQRLIASAGIWVSQIIMAGYFLLIHIDNPGMEGLSKVIASINIFLASILLGITYIKTKRLAMPLGIHFMANWVQGYLLGFGVSGNIEKGLFSPVIVNNSNWLTGGSFGLEASVPGVVMLLMMIIFFLKSNKTVEEETV